MARTFKRDGSQYYYFRVRRGGQSITESTGETDRKRAALVAARRIREIEAQGRTDQRAKRELRLIDLAGDDLAQAKQRGVSEGYYKALSIYWRNLRDFFGPAATLSSVTFDKVREYEGSRRANGIRGQSIREEVACLRRAFAIAKRRKQIYEVPDEWPEIASDPPDPKRRGKLIAMQVFRRVLGHLPTNAAEDLVFDLFTGLRSAELARVRASWLREDVLVVPAESSKTRTERQIPLGELAKRIFRRREKLFGAEPLFPRHDWRKRIAKACALEGVEGTITLRDLRTTFATLARRAGDPTAVRDILGHTRYEMTNAYLRSDMAGMVDAASAVAKALPRSSSLEKAFRSPKVATGTRLQTRKSHKR